MSGDSESSPDDPAASALDNRSAGFPEIFAPRQNLRDDVARSVCGTHRE